MFENGNLNHQSGLGISPAILSGIPNLINSLNIFKSYEGSEADKFYIAYFQSWNSKEILFCSADMDFIFFLVASATTNVLH